MLTLEQVRLIYCGAITNWSEVGGPNELIKPIVREVTASTRQNFEEFVFKGTKPQYGPVLIAGGQDEMTNDIDSFAGAIGMVTVKDDITTNPKLRMVGIDGVAATTANVQNGAYKIRRPLYIVEPPDPTTMKPGIKAFIDFVRSPEGQRIRAGF